MCAYRHMHARIHFMADMEALLGFLSQRNNHICFNHSPNFSGARFSARSPSRLREVTCSPAWLPYDQLCHFISHSQLPGPGEILSTDGFYSLGKAVPHQRAAWSACVRVKMSHRKLSREAWPSWSSLLLDSREHVSTWKRNLNFIDLWNAQATCQGTVAERRLNQRLSGFNNNWETEGLSPTIAHQR